MKKLEAPKCHWSPCGRTMFLLNESDDFWFFQCECGTSRAVSKPSLRAKTLYEKTQREVDEIRRLQQITSSRRAYSFGGSTDARH